VRYTYIKSGILYADWKQSFGQDSDTDLLVWKSTSLQMNPSLGADSPSRQQRLDPQRFAREYETEWEDDLSAFLPGQWVEDAVMRGRHELPPRDGIEYIAACDPSGAVRTPSPLPSSTSREPRVSAVLSKTL
jgi:hypothetical protein